MIQEESNEDQTDAPASAARRQQHDDGDGGDVALEIG